MTWAQGKESADGPAPATRAGSASESDSEESWSWLCSAGQTLPLPAMVASRSVDSPPNSELSPQLTPPPPPLPPPPPPPPAFLRYSNISSKSSEAAHLPAQTCLLSGSDTVCGLLCKSLLSLCQLPMVVKSCHQPLTTVIINRPILI